MPVEAYEKPFGYKHSLTNSRGEIGHHRYLNLFTKNFENNLIFGQ